MGRAWGGRKRRTRKPRAGGLGSLGLGSLGDFRSAKSGCGLWGHLAPYTGNPHQILRCSCCRHLLGDSHFEGAKSLYQ